MSPGGPSGTAPLGAGSRHEFRFVARLRPLLGGTVAGIAIFAAIIAWACWTGRVKTFDATYAAVLFGTAGFAILFVFARLWPNLRRTATMLGHVELDDEGVRWRRKDASLAFDVSWGEMERATVEPRNATLLLYRRGAPPIVLGVLSQNGVPSGFVALERFDEIAALVERRVPIAAHEGSGDAKLGLRTARLGAAACAHGALLYAANVGLESALGWKRLQLLMPIVVTAIGGMAILAGAQLRAGKGPLVSPIYGPGYRAKMIRFLVVATVANFVLLAVWNVLARY